VGDPLTVKCPQCRARVVQKSLDGLVRVRTQGVLVFGPEGAVAICKQCKAEVPLDLELGAGLRKSLDAPRAVPRLVVRNVDTSDR